MFGPPCHKCGSEFGWFPDKDGEHCSCGWPDTQPLPKKIILGGVIVTLSSIPGKISTMARKMERLFARAGAERRKREEKNRKSS